MVRQLRKYACNNHGCRNGHEFKPGLGQGVKCRFVRQPDNRLTRVTRWCLMPALSQLLYSATDVCLNRTRQSGKADRRFSSPASPASTRSGNRSRVTRAWLLLSLLSLLPVHATETDLDIALTLADILRNSRLEIASQQAHINNPDIGDKGLNGDVIVNNVLARLESSGIDMPKLLDAQSPGNELFAGQLEAIREIADESQTLINRKGVAFKGFVPAVFAQLVNERFGEKVGGKAAIKVTAPLHLVRNRKARPDAWELSVIDGKFRTPAWERGQLYSEITNIDNGEAFRVMVPEYYGEACLSCHGSPKGTLDVTGYPKEGGTLNELGGAISILLAR